MYLGNVVKAVSVIVYIDKIEVIFVRFLTSDKTYNIVNTIQLTFSHY